MDDDPVARRADQLVGDARLRAEILGPLRLRRDGAELDAGPPQQAHLMAVLLARAGLPITTDELIDIVWGDAAPLSALNTIQKYIGALRHVLEPSLAPRQQGSYIQRRSDGYMFAADERMLDLVAFRALVRAAGVASGEQHEDVALDRYAEALGLWRGAAGVGLDSGVKSSALFAAVNAEFMDAVVSATALAVLLGESDRVIPFARMAAAMGPLHEPVQASLISALGAAGQRVEALEIFTRVRVRLVEELGIDPGHALISAHRRVLNSSFTVPNAPYHSSGLVGRAGELGVLQQTVERAFTGRAALAIVEGEPGVGKTRLLQETADDARRRGALVVWGSCLEGDGTPSMWPWEQALRPIRDTLPVSLADTWQGAELATLLAPPGDRAASTTFPDSGAQFRLFEQVVGMVEMASSVQPVLLILDDLHWADVASLQLLSHLADRLPADTAIIGALRDRAPTPSSELSRVLAAASRLPNHRRIHLDPLTLPEVAELVRRETGRAPDAETAQSIHSRTAGNPFFVQELSRLLSDDGSLAGGHAPSVPATVRDVVRDRMAGLDGDARKLLQIAAIIGRDVDLVLLADAANIDVADAMERLEPLRSLGMLETSVENSFSVRFAHDLVRESVTEALAQRLAMRLHLQVADALEISHVDDDAVAEGLAYHLRAAGPLADSVRTSNALFRAGRRAALRNSLGAAERHLELAAQIARKAGLPELEVSVLSLLTLLAWAGATAPNFALMERGIQVAFELGREAESAAFLWVRVAGAYRTLARDRGTWARRMYEQAKASVDPIVRLYGWGAWGLHQWDVGNIGEAYRFFSGEGRTAVGDGSELLEKRFQRDGELGEWMVSDEFDGWLAAITALSGDVERAQLSIRETYGANGGPWEVSAWAYYETMVAALAGDPARVLQVAEKWIASGADRIGDGRGTYVRLDWYWALALTGENPTGTAADAEQLLAATLVDPPTWGMACQYALIAEMWLAAHKLDEAKSALDRGDQSMKAHDQYYAEGLLLLLRARLLHSRGEPAHVVRAAAQEARVRSDERGAGLFARRAENFMVELDRGPA